MHKAQLPTLRVAVLSDIHATEDDEFRHESHVRAASRDDPRRNPFAAIRSLVADPEAEGMHADLVLCPGDLANRVDDPGMKYAWEEVIDVATALGATHVVGSAGNHDVIRHKNLPTGCEPAESTAQLRTLAPHFPDREVDDTQFYFDEDYAMLESEHWRVVTVNSCTRHGSPDKPQQPSEFTRGYLEEKTLEALEGIVSTDSRALNILLCHHHPIRWTDLAPDDTSDMYNGDRLLKLLEEQDPCGWLLLHGHRHVPALGYAGQTSSGAVRFGAGSLGASLAPKGRNFIQNQFYILEFDLHETANLHLGAAGRFRSWNWIPSVGIVRAGADGELPGTGGFGFRRSALELAGMCEERATLLGRKSVSWEDLVAGDSRWRYVTPDDLRTMRQVLTARGVSLEPVAARSHITAVSFA